MGYKVSNIPLNTFRSPFFDIIQRDMKEGDPFIMWKTIFPGTDVIVGHSFKQNALDISNPLFIKDFYLN